MENKCIQVKGVVHSYREKEVLSDINLEVKRGEIIGLLGPSGAGKTTLIKILTGQLIQSGGSATVLGEDTGRLSFAAYKKMGMMLEHLGLYERLSCYDNLKLFAEIYGTDKAVISEVLGKTGLSDASKTAAMELSKGMRQRLLFARAILHQPQILFLDEPTSGLDPAIMKGIHQMILEQSRTGTTVFLTTHNMEEAARLCDHVALLHKGKIVEYGTPEELCRRYDHKRRIEIVLENKERLTIANCPEAAGELERIWRSGNVAAIHSSEPDLETVFMELTGAELNGQASDEIGQRALKARICECDTGREAE